MLGHYFYGKLGQMVAPDRNYEAESDPAAQSSPFWETVAPDPRFSVATAPASAIPTATSNNNTKGTVSVTEESNAVQMQSSATSFSLPSVEIPQSVEMVSSQQIATPQERLKTAQASYYTPDTECSHTAKSASALTSNYETPEQAYVRGGGTPSVASSKNRRLFSPRSDTRPSPAVEYCILEAAKDSAVSMSQGLTKNAHAVLRQCGSATTLNEYNRKNLRINLKREPELLRVRAHGMGETCPDSYTPFLVTAHANNLDTAQLIWDMVSNGNMELSTRDLLLQTTVHGRCALHIAAAQGHRTIYFWLRDRYTELGLPIDPVDLSHRTPMAAALKSRLPQGRQLGEELFSPLDPSVTGTPLDAKQRTLAELSHVVLGTAEMPGKRCDTEDNIVATTLQDCLLFAVCDGHGDRRKVAEMVGEYLVTAFDQQVTSTNVDADGKADFPLQAPSEWKAVLHQICLDCDEAIQSRLGKKASGSVAVFVIVTPSQVVVANVGDCRCILVQRCENNSESGVNEVTISADKVSLNDDSKNFEESDITLRNPTSIHKDYLVIALSVDHKPDNEIEMKRIKQTRAFVKRESYLVNGQPHSIAKVALSEDNLMACSRSFGDFEYKAEKQLDVTEQAVIAVPDVMVHARTVNDAFVIAACDGIWDVMSNDEVADFVMMRVRNNTKLTSELLPTVCDELLVECLQRGSTDNMSVVVAAFGQNDLVPDWKGKTLF